MHDVTADGPRIVEVYAIQWPDPLVALSASATLHAMEPTNVAVLERPKGMPGRNEKIEADARRVLEGTAKVDTRLNPSKYFQSQQDLIFEDNKASQILRRDFHIVKFVYETSCPNTNLKPEEYSIAEDVLGRSLKTDLHVYIAIPKKLLHVRNRTAIKIFLRFHGGGGVSSVRVASTLR